MSHRHRAVTYVGSGSPEGHVTGNVFDLYHRKDGSGTTRWYVKTSGQNTAIGWSEAGEAPGGGGTPGDTVTAETSYGLSPGAGAATEYSRADHTHGTPSLGTTGTTACAGNDARLSDARTPLPHTHALVEITDARALAALDTVATAQIDDDAVTYTKIQNVSAASKLLGRGSTGGAGDVEEITLGTNLSMSGTTLNATGGSGGGVDWFF